MSSLSIVKTVTAVRVLTSNPRIADYYESVARAHGDPKAAANWVMGEVLATLVVVGGAPAFSPDPTRIRPRLGQ